MRWVDVSEMNVFSFWRYVHVLLLLSFVLFNATPSRGEDEGFGGDELLDADFWSFEPFDDTVEKIDPEYHGHSLLLLDKAIQANPKFYFWMNLLLAWMSLQGMTSGK